MPLKKTHKRKKASRMHGRKMGTHGTGCRKNKRGSGQRGGIGMAGSGKRADQKKTLITKLYGNTYFGKQGVTSRKTARDKRKRMSLRDIERNLEALGKKSAKGWEINLGEYKILGNDKVNEKLIITAKEASKSAIESVKKGGGDIILPENKKEEVKKKSESSKKEISEDEE
jgi:large subunit ribosomal protein L15